jgi:methyl-accepting chemotaxis protein
MAILTQEGNSNLRIITMAFLKSISKKFMLVSGLMVCILMLLVGRSLVGSQVDNITSVVESRGQALVTMMVSISKFYYEEYDYMALESFATQMMEDEEVLFAGFLDENDGAIGSSEQNPDDLVDALHIKSTISDDSDTKLGSLHVVYSKAIIVDSKQAATNLVRNSTIVMIILLLLGLSLLSKIVVSKPLKSIMKTLEDVANGDLSNKANVKSNDEFGRMAGALNHAIDSMRTNLNEIKTSRERENSQSQELRLVVDQMLLAVDAAAKGDLNYKTELKGEGAIADLNSGMSSFFLGLKKDIESIDENATIISLSSQESIENSSKIDQLAKETSSQADLLTTSATNVNSGVQSIAAATVELAASIQEIAQSSASAIQIVNSAVDTARTAGDSIKRLQKSGSEIDSDVASISKIAGQTNLLALNATIEAARAGDAGKGFAVVAEEVKDLARESGEAASGIKKRILAL